MNDDPDPNSANFRIGDVALPGGLTDQRFKLLRQQFDQLVRIREAAAVDPVV